MVLLGFAALCVIPLALAARIRDVAPSAVASR